MTPALRAGVGVATITPPLPVHLAGYGDRRGVATAVHDDLEVRAVVLDGAPARVVLLTFDLLGMTRDASDPIRDAVAQVASTSRDSVLPSCTHVHAGPSALAGTDAIGWPVPEGLTALLVERAVAATEQAVNELRPARLSFARGALPEGLAINRRGHPLQQSAAVVDLHRADGERIATVAAFAIHPTITGPSNLAVATDWVGPFRRALEARGGGRVVFLQGCQGDVNPAVTEWDDGAPEAWAPVVDGYAATLAASIDAIRSTARAIACEPVAVTRARTLDVPVGDTLLGALAGGRRTRRVELVEWQVGDASIVSVPGEGFHGLEAEIRAARGDGVVLAGLAPDWHGYLPRPYTDGYEEGLSLGPDAVDALASALVAP